MMQKRMHQPTVQFLPKLSYTRKILFSGTGIVQSVIDSVMISPLVCEADVKWPGHAAWTRASSHHNESTAWYLTWQWLLHWWLLSHCPSIHPSIHWHWLKSLLVHVTLALWDLARQGPRWGWEPSVSQHIVAGAGKQRTSPCSSSCSKQYPLHSPALTFIPYALSQPDTPHLTVTREEKDIDAAVPEIKRN